MMNKITPHLIRDLHATLPPGTECYLCDQVRSALAKYRGPDSWQAIEKNQAVQLLAKQLGRGLKRFLKPEIQQELKALQINEH
jgi:hypothetical protein